MTRRMLVILVILIFLVGGMVLLSMVDAERPLERIEKPVLGEDLN